MKGNPCVFQEDNSAVAAAFNPNTNMRGPRGPRKTLIAAQTVTIGISEPMF